MNHTHIGERLGDIGAKALLAIAVVMGPAVVSQVVEAPAAVAAIARPPCTEIQPTALPADCLPVPPNSHESDTSRNSNKHGASLDNLATTVALSSVVGGMFLVLSRRRKPLY